MGRRHAAHVFLPDHYVFPGGRLERTDRAMTAAGALDPAMAARIGPDGLGRALALAAIRETFEETGFCLGVPGAPPPERVPPNWASFVARGVLPDLSALHLVARAVTPTGRPRRFDAHFFSADATAILDQAPDVVHADSELVDLLWVTLDEARALPIAGVTHHVLDALERRLSAPAAADASAPFFSWPRGRLRRIAF